jgi:hypothetical protein
MGNSRSGIAERTWAMANGPHRTCSLPLGSGNPALIWFAAHLNGIRRRRAKYIAASGERPRDYGQ